MGSAGKRRKAGPKDEDRELEEMEETIKGAIECSSTLRQRLTQDRVGPALTSQKENRSIDRSNMTPKARQPTWLVDMQETNRLSDEADHLISEADRLLGQTTDAEHETKHDENTEKLDGEQKRTEMSPEQGFWVKIVAINMNERRQRSIGTAQRSPDSSE